MNIIDFWNNATDPTEKTQIVTIIVTASNVIITAILTIINVWTTTRRARISQRGVVESSYYLPIYLHLQEIHRLISKALIDDPAFTLPLNLFIYADGADSADICEKILLEYGSFAAFSISKVALYNNHIDRQVNLLYKHISEVLLSDRSTYICLCKTKIFDLKDIVQLELKLERILYHRFICRFVQWIKDINYIRKKKFIPAGQNYTAVTYSH